MKKFKIEKGVPFPSRGYKYPFNEMNVGDSIAMSINLRGSATNCARRYLSDGKKFTIRKISDTEVRIWRIK